VLAKLATEDDYRSVRLAAVKRITDQAVLMKVANEDEDSSVRLAAVRAITDQATCVAIVLLDNSSFDARKAAFSKLTGRAALEKVASLAKDPGTQLAANVALGKTAIATALSEAANHGTNIHAVIGAVALGERQDALAEAGQLLCLRCARMQQDYRIQELLKMQQHYQGGELAELLELYGTKSLAEAWLNCGDSALHSAARGWAKSHNYLVLKRDEYGGWHMDF